jgi:hypothetical protein
VYTYAYMAAALFWLVIWAVLYIVASPQRRATLWTALLLGPAGPISEYWFLQDYWRPIYAIEFSIGTLRFGIEDYVATFALAGVCAGMFEIVAARRGFPPLPRMTFNALLRAIGWSSLGLGLMILASSALHMGSIRSLLVVVPLTALLMLAGHKRLLALAVLLAIVSALAYWLFYILVFVPAFPGVFDALWNLNQTWRIKWLGVPIEEFLWVGATMLFAGPFYRVCLGVLPDKKQL